MTGAPARNDDGQRTRELTVRDVHGHLELSACCDLYGTVMGLEPGDGSINPRLLTAMQRNGGYVVGAFNGAELIGFAYSFLARDRDDRAALYQYSAVAVVAGHMQGLGVGRRLKLAQRERCLADGIDTMRWAFDPFKTRNAHVNLDVLGGEVVAFAPAMYGERGFGADRDDESDRLIVEWALARPQPPTGWPAPPRQRWWPGRNVTDGEDILIAVPADWPRLRGQIGATAATTLRDVLRAALAAAVRSGRRGVSCRRVDADTAVYRFAPLERASTRREG